MFFSLLFIGSTVITNQATVKTCQQWQEMPESVNKNEREECRHLDIISQYMWNYVQNLKKIDSLNHEIHENIEKIKNINQEKDPSILKRQKINEYMKVIDINKSLKHNSYRRLKDLTAYVDDQLNTMEKKLLYDETKEYSIFSNKNKGDL